MENGRFGEIGSLGCWASTMGGSTRDAAITDLSLGLGGRPNVFGPSSISRYELAGKAEPFAM
jgi:hypothetical protein